MIENLAVAPVKCNCFLGNQPAHDAVIPDKRSADPESRAPRVQEYSLRYGFFLIQLSPPFDPLPPLQELWIPGSATQPRNDGDTNGMCSTLPVREFSAS